MPGTPTGLDLFRGAISRIQFDPNDPSLFYFTMFNYGAFRAKITPAGTTVTQIFTEPNPNPPGASGLAGIRFELAVAALPGGKTRVYLGEGSDQVPGIAPTVDASKLWRTDDAAAVAGNGDWTLLSSKVDGTPGFSSFDFCRNQCSYDMPVASPPGKPDEVWLGGVTQYQELPSRTAHYRSNGRAVMRSVDGGVQFTDATGDARHFFLDIHPDIHAFAFAPGGVTFVASDGGISRTSGRYVDFSSDCDTRSLTGVSLKDCRDWLSAIPDQIIAMNSGLNVLEFQALAVDPSDPNDIIGGTQDNGSPTFDGNQWRMDVLGDGGPTGIDIDGKVHYHQYSGVSLQVNWDGIDPTPGHWMWISDSMRASGEGASFYPPLTVDPVVSQTAFSGMRHVWRTKTAGGANRDFMRAHCDPLFGDLAGIPNSGCGDLVPLGGAAGDLAAGGGRGQGRRQRRLRRPHDPVGARHRDDVGRHAPRPRVHHAERGCRAGVGGDVHAARHAGAADALRQRHLRRSRGQVPRDRVLQRLRRVHARPAGARVRRALQPGTGTRDVDRPDVRPRRPAGHGRRVRRRDRRHLRRDRLRRRPARSGLDDLAAGRPRRVRSRGLRPDARAAAERRALPLRGHPRPRGVAPRPEEDQVARCRRRSGPATTAARSAPALSIEVRSRLDTAAADTAGRAMSGDCPRTCAERTRPERPVGDCET